MHSVTIQVMAALQPLLSIQQIRNGSVPPQSKTESLRVPRRLERDQEKHRGRLLHPFPREIPAKRGTCDPESPLIPQRPPTIRRSGPNRRRIEPTKPPLSLSERRAPA